MLGRQGRNKEVLVWNLPLVNTKGRCLTKGSCLTKDRRFTKGKRFTKGNSLNIIDLNY